METARYPHASGSCCVCVNVCVDQVRKDLSQSAVSVRGHVGDERPEGLRRSEGSPPPTEAIGEALFKQRR